jgi:hypothetical protein
VRVAAVCEEAMNESDNVMKFVICILMHCSSMSFSWVYRHF